MKMMGDGLPGGTSFMEDYTYHLAPAGAEDPRRAHARGLPDDRRRTALVRDPPALDRRHGTIRCGSSSRAPPGPALDAAILDLGDRFRHDRQRGRDRRPRRAAPRLPVARAVWKPKPDLATSAEAWLIAGGPHHTALTTQSASRSSSDFARDRRDRAARDRRATRTADFEKRAPLESGVLRPGPRALRPCSDRARELRERVFEANQEIVRAGLVVLTFGNASGVDRSAGVMAIKPSGVPYDELRPGTIVVVDIESGDVVDGGLRPSSDTPTHLVLYRRFGSVGGIVHTHSPFATVWAQAGAADPVLRDDACRPLPRRRARDAPAHRRRDPRRVRGADGRRDRRDDREPRPRPARDAGSARALARAVRMGRAMRRRRSRTRSRSRRSAAMGIDALALAPDVSPIGADLLERHFRRKHGASAYYGQRSRRWGRRGLRDRHRLRHRVGRGRYSSTVADGSELGTAVHPYANGVIDERLPAPDEDVSSRRTGRCRTRTTTSPSTGRRCPALLADDRRRSRPR